MEPLLDDSSTSRHQGSLDNLERARLYFERKAGRPVNTAEAREWLDSLVDYLRTARRWAREAAEREESERSMHDAQQAGHEATGISSLDAQLVAHETSGIFTIDDQQADQASDPDIQRSIQVSDRDAPQAALEASGMSSVDDQLVAHEASGISTQDVQQAAQVISPDIQRATQVPDQDALQADQQDAREYSGISGRDIPGLPSPKASRRIAARGRPRISGLNIPTNAPGISMNVRMDVHSARTAPSGQE